MIDWVRRGTFGSILNSSWRSWSRDDVPPVPAGQASIQSISPDAGTLLDDFEVDRVDPLLAYLESNPRVMLVEQIPFDSPAVDALRRDGMFVIIPLIANGKLIGILNLGRRLSGQSYTRIDLGLLEQLAMQSSVALRVAQLVREQQDTLQEQERIAQQLRLAREIQRTLLPRSIPELPGWQLSTYYQPAWEVGGDFFDFVELPDNKLAIIVGDVTDKGMPSALVMASTRSFLRAAAEHDPSPSAVLSAANKALVDDIPEMMFVTCFYLLLDPATGAICYANAGHDLPFRRCGNRVTELRATGMPLGMMPDMPYDEFHSMLEEGETIVFYSDGLVEAHDSSGEMLGSPRISELVANGTEVGPALVRRLLDELETFTGPDWRQEDDVTLVALTRSGPESDDDESADCGLRLIRGPEKHLGCFQVPSVEGNEVLAIEQVVAAIEQLSLPPRTIDRLRTAVGEAVMNGMEHGNRFREDLPVEVSVVKSGNRLLVRVFDAGTETQLPEPTMPDIDAKLEGRETPRGWGLFLMRSMVDDIRVLPGRNGKTTELILHLEEDDDTRDPA